MLVATAYILVLASVFRLVPWLRTPARAVTAAWVVATVPDLLHPGSERLVTIVVDGVGALATFFIFKRFIITIQRCSATPTKPSPPQETH